MEKQTIVRTQYVEFLLNQGKRPASVKAFLHGFERETLVSEQDFFNLYPSFEALEADIFGRWFQELAQTFKESEEYQAYPAAQRLAAIYFTWIERLTRDRSILLVMRDVDQGWGPASFIEGARESFKSLVGEVMREGIDTEQIADRFFVTQFYPSTLWQQAKWLIHFWLYDTSKEFQRTDAAVEKATRFTFDLIGPNLLDSGWDLLRFLTRGRN